MNKDKLKQIIEELREVARDTGLSVSNDVMFTNSLDYLIHTQISYAKTGNIQEDSNMASEKQKKFLETNGWVGDLEKLTKKEATVLIKEYIEGQSKK